MEARAEAVGRGLPPGRSGSAQPATASLALLQGNLDFPKSGRLAVLRLLIRTRAHGLKDFNNARKEITGPEKETNNSRLLELCSSALKNNNDDSNHNSHHLLSAYSVPGTVLCALQATTLGDGSGPETGKSEGEWGRSAFLLTGVAEPFESREPVLGVPPLLEFVVVRSLTDVQNLHHMGA